MKRVVLNGSIVVLIAALAACAPAVQEEADVVPGINEIRDRFVEAYNRHDAPAVAELYASDAVFVNPQGAELTGRDQIQRALEDFFTQARPRLSVAAMETEGAGRLGWELGTYQIDMEQVPGQPLPAEGLPGTAPPPGEPGTTAQPAPPATTPQPGQPGATMQPGQPPAGAAQPPREEGHYLIVVEQEDDRWLIRSHVAHAHGPAGTMPPQTVSATPMTPEQETPLQPGTTPQPGAEASGRLEAETAPPPTAPPGDETPAPGEDDLQPPPDDVDDLDDAAEGD